MRVGVLRRIVATLVGPGGGLLEKRELGLVALLQIIRIDRLRLDGRIDTRTTGGASRLDGALEIAGVIMTPRIDDGGFFRIRLAIALVQARPVLLETRGIVHVGLIGMWELEPFCCHR